MTVAPANQNVQRPYARPVQTWGAILKRLPEPRNRRTVQSHRRRRTHIAHRVRHLATQAATDPAIERQDESTFRPIEKARIQPTEPDPAKDLLSSKRMIALIVCKTIHLS